MTSRLRFVLGLLALLAGAGRGLAAQSGYRLSLTFQLVADTVFGVAEGATTDLVLNAYDAFGSGLDSFALRVPFDATRLDFVAAKSLCPDSVAAPATATVGSGFVDITAASCNAFYSQDFLRLTFRLRAGVTDGTLITVRPIVAFANSGADRTLDVASDLAELCHAIGLWGDVDVDGRVNSRDALIALSNAVGLPTGGFDISRGDVDGDGQVTSRDALGILSYSIQLPSYGFRAGRGIVDRCAPQALLPRPLYFSRSGTTPGQVVYGSGLSIRAANDSVVTIVGDSADANAASYQWRPRVSPDGNSVLFVCFNNFGYPNICKANAVGSGVVRLTSGFFFEQSPDWSPAGDSIVFVRNNQIYVMAGDGSGVRLIASSPSSASSVAWQPVAASRIVAYSLPGTTGGGGVHTRSLDAVPNDQVITTAVCCLRYDYRFVDWSPAGDSLVFDVYVNFWRAIFVAPNVASAPLSRRLQFQNLTQQPAWTDEGILFVDYHNGRYGLFIERPSGAIGRLSRDTRDNFVPGMKRVP